MSIQNLRDLLTHELMDVYSAEKQIIESLPEMAEAAEDEELKASLNHHLEETKGQVTRLERVGEILGVKMEAKTCKAMKGLIEEGRSLLKETKGTPAGDAAIILACQKVEHYEIASYGSLAAYAEELAEEEVMQLLQETLQEESNTNEKLDEIAIDDANSRASGEELFKAGNM
jgi:ferritin-like metal-binding protein YciE